MEMSEEMEVSAWVGRRAKERTDVMFSVNIEH